MSEDADFAGARGFPAFGATRRAGRGFASSWWGNSWVTSMEESALDLDQLKRGRRYAKTGHVGPITVSTGRISAPVHDGDHFTPFQTVLTLQAYTDPEWDRLIDQVAAKSGHIAALIDHELPPELVQDSDDAGLGLLPGIGDLDPECDCPDWGHPCLHAAALAYQVSWLLDVDPFLLLLIRGRTEAEVLSALRSRQAQAPAPATEATTGTPALEAYRSAPGPLPAPGPAQAFRPVVVESLLEVTAPAGPDPAVLALLIRDAARRAAALLAGEPAAAPLTAWPDAVRLGADFTEKWLQERLSAGSGRGGDLPRAVAAWRFGGAEGLRTHEDAWTPPPAVMQATARSWTSRLRSDDPVAAVSEPRLWRNRLTLDPARVQLRYGRDGRWYPYRGQSDGWWPAGRPARDALAALDDEE